MKCREGERVGGVHVEGQGLRGCAAVGAAAVSHWGLLCMLDVAALLSSESTRCTSLELTGESSFGLFRPL